VGFLICVYLLIFRGDLNAVSGKQGNTAPNDTLVSVVHLHTSTFERVTVQPGSVEAFQFVQLYAGVSGFLKDRKVDIGDPVKKGQVLAILAVPDLEKQVQHHKATVEQTEARVKQLKAKLETANAEHEAAEAAVPQAEHAAKSAKAWTKYRKTKLKRYQDLTK